jgi:hypothetical protein
MHRRTLSGDLGPRAPLDDISGALRLHERQARAQNQRVRPARLVNQHLVGQREPARPYRPRIPAGVALEHRPGTAELAEQDRVIFVVGSQRDRLPGQGLLALEAWEAHRPHEVFVLRGRQG